ncbi:hypothetical protein CLF_107198 [Clonorchis sinensis]|uniref:Uncharacterized protein n=1 Tax=Clonorchis sinensis TaxID=79923 RepID=G7YGB6_CLOSI|nr:hypothetical protein CLF_107198 [Clonorchis sinensis]
MPLRIRGVAVNVVERCRYLDGCALPGASITDEVNAESSSSNRATCGTENYFSKTARIRPHSSEEVNPNEDVVGMHTYSKRYASVDGIAIPENRLLNNNNAYSQPMFGIPSGMTTRVQERYANRDRRQVMRLGNSFRDTEIYYVNLTERRYMLQLATNPKETLVFVPTLHGLAIHQTMPLHPEPLSICMVVGHKDGCSRAGSGTKTHGVCEIDYASRIAKRTLELRAKFVVLIFKIVETTRHLNFCIAYLISLLPGLIHRSTTQQPLDFNRKLPQYFASRNLSADDSADDVDADILRAFPHKTEKELMQHPPKISDKRIYRYVKVDTAQISIEGGIRHDSPEISADVPLTQVALFGVYHKCSRMPTKPTEFAESQEAKVCVRSQFSFIEEQIESDDSIPNGSISVDNISTDAVQRKLEQRGAELDRWLFPVVMGGCVSVLCVCRVCSAIRFDRHENDVCTLHIDKVFVRYLKTGVQKINETPCALNGPKNTHPCQSQFVKIPWRIVTTITTLNDSSKMFMYGSVHGPKYGVAMTIPRLPYPVCLLRVRRGWLACIDGSTCHVRNNQRDPKSTVHLYPRMTLTNNNFPIVCNEVLVYE